MNQTTPKEKTTNTQSIRLPMELYERIGQMALEEDSNMNTVILRLIRFGLGHQINFEKAVQDFVFRRITPREAENLANGNPPIIHT